MNKVSLAVNAVLGIAVVGLYVMQFNVGNVKKELSKDIDVAEVFNESGDTADIVAVDEVRLETEVIDTLQVEEGISEVVQTSKFAFVDIDLINSKWGYFKRIQKELEDKYNPQMTYFEGRIQDLEKESAEMEKQYNETGIADQAAFMRVQSDYGDVMKKRQALMQELEVKGRNINFEASQRIKKVIVNYAKDKKLLAVTGTGEGVGSPVLYNEASLDVTNAILLILNKKYK